MGVHDELTRRVLIRRASLAGLAALTAAAAPVAWRTPRARAAAPLLPDATLQAFADTMIPGRKAARTDRGNDIHPQAIAGVDTSPGAVEADALALYKHPKIGFDALQVPFLADLERRALLRGAPFLSLSFDARTATCVEGLDFANPTRIVWEAAAAVPFTAFCAAALVPEQTAAKASGYRVMGLPGATTKPYRAHSYNRRLNRERTPKGNLP